MLDHYVKTEIVPTVLDTKIFCPDLSERPADSIEDWRLDTLVLGMNMLIIH